MSIYRRKSGRYAVLVDVERAADGRRQRRALGTFATRKEAERVEREAMGARDRGIDLSPRTVTVTEMMMRQLREADSRCGAKTMERYREISTQYIEPHLGAIVLAKLRPAHISDWCTTLLRSGGAKGRALSPKTVRHAFALLKSALSWAIRMQLAAANPAAAVKPPHAVRADSRAFSADEVMRLFDAAAESRWLPLFQFALATGARRGEIAALRWDAVDIEAGIVTIRASLSQTKGVVTVKSTKTDRARAVPLSPFGIDALRRQRSTQAQEKLAAGGGFDDRGYVFTGPLGGVLRPFTITDAFRKLADKAKVPVTSIHALRHTAATWMLAGGVDVRSAAGILGHSTPSTTLGIYAHAIASAQVAAVETIDARLRGARDRA